MKRTALIFLMAASAATLIAQTPAKPSAPAATAAKPAATASKAPAASGGVNLPPGVPPVKVIVKTAFSLRYQDIKIGTGPEALPQKMYKVQYTGWLAADGHKFDSSYDHPRPPVLDKDGKPVLGEDGKPKQGDPQPMPFPQGMGRLIPGFDQGFAGMKVGGKRRIFIPWQLAYGAIGRPGPDAAHPGIPPKADLIFDVELVDVADLPMPPNHPGMGGMPGAHPMPGSNVVRPQIGSGDVVHPQPAPPPASGTNVVRPQIGSGDVVHPQTTPSSPAAPAPGTPAQPGTPAPPAPATPPQPQPK